MRLSNAERQALWRARQAASRPVDLDELHALAELLDSPAVAGILLERFGGLAELVAADPAATVRALPQDADPVAVRTLGRKLAAIRTVWQSTLR